MDNHSSPDQTYKIGILLIDGFALMSYSSVIEPLRAGNFLAKTTLYQIDHIAVGNEYEIISSSGAAISANTTISENKDYDLILVVAGGDPSSFDDQQTFQWLRNKARHGVRLGGVSGGPVILANAGVMKGYRMTVHWEHAAALSENTPTLLLERSLYIMDRDRITCAGGVAPLDMMHVLQSEIHGPEFARRVSDWFIHTDVRPPGDPQRSGMVERYGTHHPSIIQTLETMENHIADPLSLKQLALLSSISPRQLNRIFIDKIGQSTMSVYRSLRLEKAYNLIQHTVLSLTEIALATGFSSSAHFSKAFQDKYGSSPSSYRQNATF
ncbi:transcriptional regulator [Kiloniella litopenaei]|uniref:Transcriptional regulator n=1 Tax=Kiloniella litopenaei TaxID=1549748 RepID=A0A0M2R9Q2_9PROT|nr:GlxA family transcriptional regulator [Kiloniella litopenaei]KKJ76705.1 transcriptional regulator [Kiloniella litopenaei]